MLQKIDHLGIAVKSIDQALKLYENILGLQSVDIETVAEQKVKVAFLPLAGSEIELLESTDPGGPIAKFIEAKGEGIQHLAFRVDDLEETLNHLKAAGIALIDETPRRGAGGAKIAFIHPRATFGTLIELCERQD